MLTPDLQLSTLTVGGCQVRHAASGGSAVGGWVEPMEWELALDGDGHGDPDLKATTRAVKASLARELHDRVAQTLTAMLVEMENFKATRHGRGRVAREVTMYQEATREVLNNIRNLLFELRGEAEVGLQFVPRVREKLRHFEQGTGISTELRVSRRWPRQLAAQAGTSLIRILEEALHNVRLHSGAERVSVSLGSARGERAVLTVRDDGRGLDTLVGDRSGMGMLGMRERALLLGGELQVEPVIPHGTLLRAVFPKERLLWRSPRPSELGPGSPDTEGQEARHRLDLA